MLGVLLLCLLIAGRGHNGPGGTRADGGGPDASGRPNIVVVMTDDQGIDMPASGFPRPFADYLDGATDFEQSIVATPLCCPSRATFLSGQYGHNNGILRNRPGYPELREKDSVLPVWMQEAGYRTAMVGKYMNGFSDSTEGREKRPAPGWEEWTLMLRSFSYYGFTLLEGGEEVEYGERRRDYLTSVLNRAALDSIRRLEEDPRPLFLYMPVWAPHNESERLSSGPCKGFPMPPNRRPAPVAAEFLPVPEKFEGDLTDKPPYVQRRDPIDAVSLESLQRKAGCQAGSLTVVESGIERIRTELEEIGELDETVFIYTSDNGQQSGQHRLTAKAAPYEPAIRVPLVIDLSVSMGPQPDTVDAPASNIDLAPTILDVAGGRPCSSDGLCRALDGRSLLPLLTGEAGPEFDRRPLLIETREGAPCPYSGVRQRGWILIDYPASEIEGCEAPFRELYDLGSDPGQELNLLAAGPPTDRRTVRRLDSLEPMLDELRSCGGGGSRRCRKMFSSSLESSAASGVETRTTSVVIRP